jgi:hypothetical protein
VELTAVKFCKVDDPLTRRFANVPRPVDVKSPPLPVVKKRLVVEAVVANRFVVVALDEVELTAVKFWRVVEPETVRAPSVPIEVVAVRPTLKLPEVRMVLQRLVDEAWVLVLLVMLLKMCAPVHVGEKV